MIALGVCLVAFIVTFWAAKRSLSEGIIALLFWGYLYGIVRANLATAFSHFIFDAAMLGMYLAQREALFASGGDRRTAAIRTWTAALILWPTLLIFAPFQPVLISLVGYRGSVFFLPLLLLGSRLRSKDILKISIGLAALNIMTLGFALGEYFLGIPRFFPENAVTQLIYASSDVAGGFNRIPGTFGTAHLYGGAMLATLPFLIGAWSDSSTRLIRMAATSGVIAALVGVLMSATRLNFILASAIIVASLWSARMGPKRRLVFVLLIVAVGGLALRNERFQRFKSLSDTDYVQDRISGSVNKSFIEILFDYPMGNGLGGGGTSIPYFLEGQVRNPIGMENEYARILSEQGIVGLLIWIGFAGWYLSRCRIAFAKTPLASCRKLVWSLNVIELCTGCLGVGLLTAIPCTALMLLGMGWSVTEPGEAAPRKRPLGVRRVNLQLPAYRTAPHI